MKRLFLFASTAFLFTTMLGAQKRKIFKINPGEKLVDNVPIEDVFAYPVFTAGNVYFKNGTYCPAQLNYNALLSEIQFIDAKGDTLSLSDESTIRVVVIKADTFFYDKGYVKQVADYGNIKLGVREFFSFVNRQKIGGFGETTSGSIATYNVNSSNYFKDLIPNELLTIAKTYVFYLGDRFNNFKALNKKTLFDFYPKKEKELQAYLKENKVDFSDGDEIKKMIAQLSSVKSQ